MSALGERFEVHEVLGRGSFGDVYLATDRTRGAQVAVKRLRAPEERQVQRFKQEFRALCRLHHPNLVTLYELSVTQDEWLLLMEPVRGHSPTGAASWRAALPGIAEGLNALHGAGYLHRDLKPENLVVTPEGRAVLLDFGVLGRSGKPGQLVGNLMGIAPEQAAGREVGPASDWYALGAMLYRALTGADPFEGRGAQVLARKMRESAPRVRSATEPALAELTNALLLRDPVERLAEAMRLLPTLGAPSPAVQPKTLFVGRRSERTALDAALARAREGRVEHVRIRGAPGMGKSALLEAWTAAHPRAIWLRCFEQDGSAYAGLDLVVEASCAEAAVATQLSEAQRAALATLFPGIGWAAPERPMEPVHTLSLAAEALRGLLRARATDGCPLLLVDDVQWGGEDSGRLIGQLVEAPWLVVTATRDGVDPGALTRTLDERHPARTTLELSPLDAHDLDCSAGLDPKLLARALRRAEGHPLFLNELLHAESSSSELLPLLRARASALPQGATSLMRVLVAAARPLDRELALNAYARLPESTTQERPFHDVTVLLRERMARLSHTHAGARLEPTHALIREACEAELSVGPRVHAALDDAMQALAIDEPDHQARHARAAGRGRRAARLYERAGERAARSLAFRRASELYALGRECADDDSTRQRLDVARARALGSAGLHRSAADAFEQALRGRALVASDSETMTLQRERAEHLLHAGAMREGERALETCLRALGLRSRPTRRGLLASILMHQLWLRTLGTRGPRAPSAEPSRLEQARVDLCFSAALALTNVDTLRGMDFALCSARRAHTLGDRHRFARSYALITAYSGSPGGKARARVSPMIARVCRFAEEFSDPRLRGMAQAAECLLLFHSGEHAESLALAEQAETTFREEAGAPREATTALIYRCANLASLGRFEALAETRRELLEDSLARHDGFGETHARSGLMNLVWLVDDDPETAEEELRRGMERWREVEFQFAHFFALLAGSRIDLYRGDPAACLERLSAASGGLASSLFLRMPYVRAQISDLHGRAWLALAAQDSSKSTRRRALREARREVRRIRGLGAAIHAPLADVIEAGTTLLLGRESESRTLLRAALHAFDERGLQGHAFTTTHVLEALGDAPARCLPDRDAPKDATRFVCALGLATAGA